MSTNTWSDIPGVTHSRGRPRLPARPEVVVALFTAAVEAVDRDAARFSSLVEEVRRTTGADRQRVEGLAGWLPLSRVARWSPTHGALWLHPDTDALDLAKRYAAWVHSQPVPRASVEGVTAYARAVVELAAAAPHRRAPRAQPLPSPPPAEEAPSSRPPLLPPALTEKLRRLIAALDAPFLERRVHTRAALLALLSGQHVLLLGPPGTAKSMLARALCQGFQGATYFEYLLSRFTHPDELFGPVSIPGLKEEDYRRLTEGFLPQAHVAFLDEIFKANSAILNSLLTLVNERVFHHGRHRDPVPLLGLVGASNELPDPDGGLGALYDRFLVRLTVPPVAEASSFLAVATGALPPPEIPADAVLGPEDLQAIQAAAPQVEVPPVVQELLLGLWRQASASHWEVSDRRWRQAVHMLKVAAATDGRREVLPVDLLLLVPVLAPTPSHAAEARDAVMEHIAPTGIPEHDLRAQWLLLHSDLVAPSPDERLTPVPPPSAPLCRRLACRRQSVDRFLRHHRATVRRLAEDRRRLERLGEAHLWIDRFPAELLSAHIASSRDLAAILTVAERYADTIRDPDQLAQSLVESLPESQRVYGHTTSVRLVVPDARVDTGLTPQGERVRPLRPVVPERGRAHRPASTTRGALQVPSLVLSTEEFLRWADGGLATSALAERLPSWAGPKPLEALAAAARILGKRVLPPPPELPAP